VPRAKPHLVMGTPCEPATRHQGARARAGGAGAAGPAAALASGSGAGIGKRGKGSHRAPGPTTVARRAGRSGPARVK
jgi:hypothetical protein